jgi:hypothetical protein
MISDTIAILFVLLIVAAPIAGILLWARREDRETLTEMEERIAIYEEAAEIIELNPDQRGGYWMAEFSERIYNPEAEERRILALCFMMAMIETGDA